MLLAKIISELQGILPDGEVIIVTEIGNEKMRYLIWIASVITNNKVEHVNLSDLALDKAREMLSNPDYYTQMDY
jgi:hypothetical protein